MDPILIGDDAGPKIAGTIWALVGISGIFLALRLYVKAIIHRHIWWDDSFLIASWVMLTTSTAIDTYAITEGFGKHIEAVPPPSVLILSMLIPVSSVFSLLGAAWSKTSFALTLLRITDSYVRTAIWIIIGTLNLALMVNAILPFARCVPASRGWSRLTEGSCWFSLEVGISYSVFAGVYSAAMDILLALIPWAIILHLRMKTKEKIGVALCMSLGFVAGATGIVRVTTIPLLARADFTYEGGRLAIWSVAEIATTIMAASVPVLRPLVMHPSALSSLPEGTTTRLRSSSSSFHRRRRSRGNPYRQSADDGTFFLKPPPRLYGAAAHATSTVCTSEGRPSEQSPRRSPSRALSLRHHRRKKKAEAAVTARELRGAGADDDDDNNNNNHHNGDDDIWGRAEAEGKIVRVQTVNVAYDVRTTLRDSMRSLVSPAVPPAAAVAIATPSLPSWPSTPRSKLGGT